MTDTDETFAQYMEKLNVDTLGEALVKAVYMADRLREIDAAPAPLLTVTADGQIMLRKDLSVRGLVGIIEALERLPLSVSK